MNVLMGIVWTLVSAGAQVAWIAALAGIAFGFKRWIEIRHDREDERRRRARCG